jgi:hypothetical protein
MSLRGVQPRRTTKQSIWIATARYCGPRDDKSFCMFTLVVGQEKAPRCGGAFEGIQRPADQAPSWKRTKRRTCMFSPSFAIFSVRMSLIILSGFLTKGWSRRQTCE